MRDTRRLFYGVHLIRKYQSNFFRIAEFEPDLLRRSLFGGRNTEGSFSTRKTSLFRILALSFGAKKNFPAIPSDVEPDNFFRAQELRWINDVHMETRLFQAAHKIAPVNSDMIGLPEKLQALGWFGHREILERFSSFRKTRYQDGRPAFRFQHPYELAHGLSVVGNMLQNMATQNHIETIGREGNDRDIHFHFGSGIE